MDRNLAKLTIARRVNLAISEAGIDVNTVARAADITTNELEERLLGRADFEPVVLVRVGGFLRIPASRFFKEAA